MPEITQADRDRFQEWHDFEASLAPISGDDKQRLLEAFAAHREAERERIIGNLTAHVEVLLKKNAAYAAVGLQDYIDEIKQVATTTPPTRSPTATDNQTKGCDMDAKFTPGPWISRPSPVDPKPWRCVYFSAKRDEPYCTSALEPADARLIAAAPDLYEALRELIASVRGKGPRDGKTMARADAALAKAAK